ncbi:SDR family NAD(P)-dependent oxidoreductase [Falsiroseomonas sp. E2-1-a20]|uniref:SDR family NAD(P)-dependent oxidoreductase n=1 Tax=Falsiroseomonas sp. E2-1-a20 TaxID=3239300 RepID=UPI003F594AC8
MTGGASGMGKATARLLLEGGGKVLLLGRNTDRLAAAAAELRPLGAVAITVLDLADPAAVEAFAARIAGEHGDLTGLVNAAGVFLPKSFLDHGPADYDLYLALNRGTFFLTQAVARAMVARGQGGSTVNIGSMWARQAVAATPSSAYSMAKAGLHAMTQHLAMELATHRIRVKAVSPPWWKPRSTRASSRASRSMPRCRASTASTRSGGSARRGMSPASSPSSCPAARTGSPGRSGMSMAA